MSISVKLQKAVYTAVAAAMILGAMFAYSVPKTLAAPAYDYELIHQSSYPSTLAPGETTNVWIEVKNTGSATWYNDVAPTIRLGSGSAYGAANQQRDYDSEFYDSASWLSMNRPVQMLHPEIRPGWHTRFQFNIKAPSTAGVYKAYFTPVADGLTWMKDIGIYWQLTVAGEGTGDDGDDGEEGTAEGTTVSLSSSTPAASTVLIGATGVPYLKFNIESDGDIDEIVVKRTGVGASSDFENVYLYDGNTRLTSGRSVASDTHMATFINLGLSGASKTLTLKADISATAGALNQSAFEVYSVNGNVLSSAVKGSTMTIGSQTMDTAIIAENSAAWTVTLGESQAEVARFSIDASGATNDVDFEAITLRQSGSLSNANLENLTLKEGSNELATTSEMDGEKAVFVLSSPYTITKGQTKYFAVYGDITGGRTTDNIQFYIDEKTDVTLTDSVYDMGMQLTNNFAYGDQVISLEGGAITLVDNGPAVTTFAVNSTQNTFLDFAVTSERNATVKKAKVNMKIYNAGVEELYGAANFGYLKNIRIVDTDTDSTIAGPLAAASSGTCVEEVNGGVGGVCDAGDNISYYKEFTDQFDLLAGETRNLALKADIDTSFTTTGRTIVLGLDLSGANYVYDTDASEYVANTEIVPNTLTGNSMSVGSDSLTVSLASTPVTSTSIKRATDVLAVGHLLKSGDTNDSRVTKLVYTGQGDLGAGYAAGNLDDIVAAANLYVDGSEVAGPVSVNTSGVITFNNLDIDILAGQTKKVELAVDISSTAGVGNDDKIWIGIANDTDITVENGDGNSFTAVDADGAAPWDGNDEANDDPTVEINVLSAGSIASSLDADTPDSAVAVAGDTSSDVLKVKFTTQYEAFTLNKMKLYVDVDNDSAAGAIDAESTADNNISSVILSYNGTSATGYLSGGMVEFTGLGIDIPKDDDLVVSAKVNYNSISAGATSGEKVELVYDANDGFEAVGGDSGSTVTDSTTDIVGGGIFTVRKTVPTFALNSSSPSGTLIPGVTEVIRIDIIADSGGDVIFDGTDTIDFDIASSATGLAARTFDLYDASTNNKIATQVSIAPDNANTVAFTDVSLTIAAGTTKTVYVKGDLQDYSTQGDTFRLDINDTSGLTWGDGEVANIATDTALLEGIPLTGNTLVKP